MSSSFRLPFISFCAAFVVAAQSVLAQQSIPVKLVDGALVAQCLLKTPAGLELPANVVIDLGWRSPLVLHTKAAGALELDKDPRVDVVFPEYQMTGLKPAAREMENLEILTRDYGSQMGEIPAVGMMGLGAFGERTVQLDLAAGVLRIWDADSPAKPRFAENDPNLNMTEFEMQQVGLVIYANSEICDPFTLLLTTQRHHSVLNSQILKQALTPDGTLRPFYAGKLNLPAYCAFQPTKLDKGMPFKPSAVVATSALAHFRITIDIPAKRVIWEQRTAPLSDDDDQRAMIAIFRHDIAGLETYLAKHGDRRLAREAADELVEERFNEDPIDKEACSRAVKYYAATMPPERRARSLVIMVDNFLKAKDPNQLVLAEKILEFAAAAQNLDVDAAAVHAIHARQGYLALLKKDYPTARRMLIAAAFGLPRDPTINVWLADYYRQTGQPMRAWSRYAEAAFTKEPPIEAFVGLDSMLFDPETRKSLNIADLEVLLEGRVPAFSPPKARVIPNTDGLRLIEIFSSVGNEESVGAELAGHGLQQYYGDAGPVFIQHNLDRSLGTAFGKRQASLYGIEKSPAIAVNGAIVSKKGGKESETPALFAELLASVDKQTEKAPWQGQLVASAISDGKEISGSVKIDAKEKLPAGDLRLYVLLCERCIIAIGGNGSVLHYSVARAEITPEDGFAMSGDAPREYSWREKWSTIQQNLDAYWKSESKEDDKFRMRPTYADQKESFLVAFIQDRKNNKIVAAKRIPIVSQGSSHD